MVYHSSNEVEYYLQWHMPQVKLFGYTTCCHVCKYLMMHLYYFCVIIKLLYIFRTKHIEIHFHFLGTITISYVLTNQQHVNIFNKAFRIQTLP
ncbi:hypothetical protein CR513_11423, partial [Mucuna pruriens]